MCYETNVLQYATLMSHDYATFTVHLSCRK